MEKIQLAQRGIFVAARDPHNLDVSFGFTRTNTILKIGETVSVSDSKITQTALYQEVKPYIATAPRGNIDIWLEYIKR